MIKVLVGKESPGAFFKYTVPEFDLSGKSRQPLLDACREIIKVGGDKNARAGLFRGDRAEADLSCRVGIGARMLVDESGPCFKKWKPFPHGTVSSTRIKSRAG
jgi:hypothetical protein